MQRGKTMGGRRQKTAIKERGFGRKQTCNILASRAVRPSISVVTEAPQSVVLCGGSPSKQVESSLQMFLPPSLRPALSPQGYWERYPSGVCPSRRTRGPPHWRVHDEEKGCQLPPPGFITTIQATPPASNPLPDSGLRTLALALLRGGSIGSPNVER